MIYTVTFNPALDYIMRVPSLETDTVNRTDSESVFMVERELTFPLY